MTVAGRISGKKEAEEKYLYYRSFVSFSLLFFFLLFYFVILSLRFFA